MTRFDVFPAPASAIAFAGFAWCILAAADSIAGESTEPAEFVVWSDDGGFVPPQIVVQFNAEQGTGVDWKLAVDRPWYDRSQAAKMGDAVGYLRHGVERLCGQRLEVVNSAELQQGIVLTTSRSKTRN